MWTKHHEKIDGYFQPKSHPSDRVKCWTLSTTWECWVLLLPAVFGLWNTRIHISISYSHNIVTNIEGFVDEIFYFNLSILYIDPDNCHIRLWRYFDDSWFWDEQHVVKDVIRLDSYFNKVCWNKNISIFDKERNVCYFQVRFWLRKLGSFNVIRVDIFHIFNNIFYSLKIKRQDYFVSNNDDICRFSSDIIHQNIQFDVSKSPINVSDINTSRTHKFVTILFIHKDNNLFL